MRLIREDVGLGYEETGAGDPPLLMIHGWGVERTIFTPLTRLYVGTSTPYANLARFKELCPSLVTGQVVGASHYFPLEVPEQLGPMIRRFLATTARSVSSPRAP